MSEGDYRVADISLADFGRREIDIAEHEVSDFVSNGFDVSNKRTGGEFYSIIPNFCFRPSLDQLAPLPPPKPPDALCSNALL